MKYLDRFTELASRKLARGTSRRSLLTRIGSIMMGTAVIPLLPVARTEGANAQATQSQDPGDPTSCDYWRHCAISGFLCGCCGGTATSCPPGTEMSPVAWIGTCQNPADGRNYIISYNDCCGGPLCNTCGCGNNEGERPLYLPHMNNGILWCLGLTAQTYTCTTAIIVGVALDD